jgi:hypothetical protein
MITNNPHANQDEPVSSRYNSFLLRCWRVSANDLRIKIEHVQSGEQTQVTTVAEAIAWMSNHWSQPSDDGSAILDQPGIPKAGALSDK